MRVSRKRQLLADGLMLLVTMIWGGTFVMVKDATSSYPVFPFLSIRFGMATLALILVAGKRLRKLDWKGVSAGVLIGLFLFGGYALQTLGLQYTSASKAALITGLSVVLVPLISGVLSKKSPGVSALVGVGLATAGLFWLTLGGASKLSIQSGDLIVLGAAICFALHIVSVSVFAPRSDALALTIVQLATVAVLSIGITLIQGSGSPIIWPTPSWNVIGAAAFTGILATAVAFSLQTAMQRFTTPTHTALIFAAEPVFGVLFGVLLANEPLTAHIIAGGSLIVFGTIASEMNWDYELAERLEDILSPPIVFFPLLLLLGQLGAESQLIGLYWSLGISLFSIVGLVFVFRGALKRGAISDFYVSRRLERMNLKLVVPALISVTVPTIMIWVFNGPTGLRAGFAAMVVLAAINLAVTSVWKISYHSQVTAATATAFVLTFGTIATPLLLLIPVVIWARVKLDAHTLPQTLVGAFVGAGAIVLAFKHFLLF